MKPDSTDTPATEPTAPQLWRGLEDLAPSPEARAAALNEFPEGATEFVDEPSRRRFLALASASVALATGACRCKRRARAETRGRAAPVDRPRGEVVAGRSARGERTGRQVEIRVQHRFAVAARAGADRDRRRACDARVRPQQDPERSEPGAPLGEGFNFGTGDGSAYRQPAVRIGRVLTDRRAMPFIALWFGVNFLFGVGAQPLGLSDNPVAWEAHIGGFLAGLLLFAAFDPVHRNAGDEARW